jgi:ankyrin repeat protein
MLCQQTTVLIDTLLLRCSANIFAEETLPKRRSITTLDIAAAHGYLNVVKKLLSNSNNIAEYFYIKSTKEAILYDHLEVVEHLVSNFKGSNDQIHDLMLTAVEYNKIKVVDYLIGTERMAGMNPVKMSQCICYAIQFGYFEMVQYLLSLPFVKIDHEMLKAALNYIWPDIIKHIVDRKKQLSENAADYNMLMIAALEGDDAAVHYLIEQGLVDVNGVAPDGTTALFCALQSGKISLVKYLIERQANANAIKKDGTTLLMKAVELGFDQAIVEYFLMSCDINAATKNGLTALMYASLSGRTNIVELFVNEYNASIDAVDRFGATALVYAAKGGHFEIVKFLVEKQTDSLWLPAQCILALKEININQLKEVNIELWNDRGRIINNGCYISYNVPNAFLIIARYLISQPVLIDSYFSDEHNNFIPDLVMQRIHQDVLDYLAIMDVQDSLYSLSHYYLYNKKTANYAETLCVNLLISIKQALPMPNKQLISLIEKFLCFKKLLKIVSCHFVAALREIQEKLRWLVKTTETEEEKPFSLESNTVAPLLLLPASQDKAKITSSWRGGFSLFSFCCGNDSAALEENRLPQSPSHFPSPVSSSS